MREHEINKLDNFICGYYLDDNSICDLLIDYFHQSKTKVPGMTGAHPGKVDASFKDSTDCTLLGDMLLKYAHDYLDPCLQLYKQKYPYVDRYDPWAIMEGVNIQHYSPGGGFHAWHTERTGVNHTMSRHLVFMTYLNTVTDCGETEWFHQKVKVKPEKGLTVFWPADWTFTHRGVASPSQDKYIVTGWFNYKR